MKEVVLIKFYRNDFSDDDYHDWMIEVYCHFVQALEDYFIERGKRFYFMPLSPNVWHSAPVNGTPFAEIEYTGTISVDEKQECIKTLQKLSSDIEWYEEKKGRKKELIYREFSSLKLVKFRRLEMDEELVFLEEMPVNCSSQILKKEQ